MNRAAFPAAAILVFVLPGFVAAQTLARRGEALARIVVPELATPVEKTAAAELSRYLGLATGGRFDVVTDVAAAVDAPAILVGRAATAGSPGGGAPVLGPEEWVVRADGERLRLYGGEPRGTLYATYRFLERYVGVRWWTPYDETVPRHRVLKLGRLDERGSPSFAYRDVHGVHGPVEFRARSRHNGQFSRLPAARGGAERYGPPSQVHDFYLYVPPEEYFSDHPEFFSEIGGLRFGGDGQLCLTNGELLDLVEFRMRAYIAESVRTAAAEGEAAPRLFDFSPNDWGRPCECEHCTALAESEGSASGPLLAFVNELARRIADDHPDVLVDTLAYRHTFLPPRSLHAADNVVIRVSALFDRDFLQPVTGPANRGYRESLEAWVARTRRLRIWDYSVMFGEEGEFPLPNLPVLAEDYRFYAGLGVDGVFLQHEYPIAGDMGDLKLWVLSRLLDDPANSLSGLVREFTDGYYGPAGKTVRRYRRLLERSAADHPSRIRYGAAPRDYRYLDASFIAGAHRLFDRAERRVAGDLQLLSRVRHARLALDRATLALWPTLGETGSDRATRLLDFESVARRYRRTWEDQAARRVGPDAADLMLREVDREIAHRRAAVQQ